MGKVQGGDQTKKGLFLRGLGSVRRLAVRRFIGRGEVRHRVLDSVHVARMFDKVGAAAIRTCHRRLHHGFPTLRAIDLIQMTHKVDSVEKAAGAFRHAVAASILISGDRRVQNAIGVPNSATTPARPGRNSMAASTLDGKCGLSQVNRRRFGGPTFGHI